MELQRRINSGEMVVGKGERKMENYFLPLVNQSVSKSKDREPDRVGWSVGKNVLSHKEGYECRA